MTRTTRERQRTQVRIPALPNGRGNFQRREAIRWVTIIALALVLPASAQAKGPSVQVRTSEAIVATWTCQTQLGLERTAARSPWKPHSKAFRRDQLNRWTLRKKACLKVLHARGAMIRRLQRGLAGTHMAGTEVALERAGRRYGVHPAFIAAIAGTESSFGAAACSNNRFNAFGLSSCGSGWRVPNFQSWEEVYLFMGAFLSGRWPHAATTYDFGGYAANSRSWGAKCAYWMQTRFGLGNGVRYAS